MALAKLCNLAKLQFSHLKNGDDEDNSNDNEDEDNTYLIGWFRGLDEIILIKFLALTKFSVLGAFVVTVIIINVILLLLLSKLYSILFKMYIR